MLNVNNHVDMSMVRLKHDIRSSLRTKFITYRCVNAPLCVPSVYRRSDIVIPERLRVVFSRMRLSSHNLRIETGRWSRLARQDRLCGCGEIQDEKHVLCDCPMTQHLRNRYIKPVLFPDILNDVSDVCDYQFVFDVLDFFT